MTAKLKTALLGATGYSGLELGTSDSLAPSASWKGRLCCGELPQTMAIRPIWLTYFRLSPVMAVTRYIRFPGRR